MLQIKVFFLRLYYIIRKPILNCYFKKTQLKNPQSNKYDQILIALKNKPNLNIENLRLEISGATIKRDYKEIPKVGKSSVIKAHPTYDSLKYLILSCEYLIKKDYIQLHDEMFSIKPEANMLIEEKGGFVKELNLKIFDSIVGRWLKSLRLVAILASPFFVFEHFGEILKFFNSILNSSFCD